MLKTVHAVCTYLIVALGILHLLFTFHDYDAFTLRALWFASAGFAIMFAGFLNLILLRATARDARLVRALCFIANLICAGLFGAALLLMRQPQVFVGLLLFTLAAITSLALRQQPSGN
jgi:hypothetical protein